MKKEPPWSLLIKRATNGYVLEHPTQLDNGAVRTDFIAVEENAEGDEAKCAQRLLWEVLEHFGIYKGIEVVITDDNGDEVA